MEIITGTSAQALDTEVALSKEVYVYLESKLVKGYFRVSQIKIEGDNFSETWQCSARLLEIE